MVKILIAEDEAAIVTLLKYNLEKEGFDLTLAEDGQKAVEILKNNHFDLAILDWMMPKLDGLQVCEFIRQNDATVDLPVIMLTARGEEADKVMGLSIGADDYITKPFSVAELIARIKAVLRRIKPIEEKGTLSFADILIDLEIHKVSRNDRIIHLGPTEFRLLKFLMENPHTVFSREDLLLKVWGENIYVEPRTVDVHIRRLRKALNLSGEKDLIRTIRAYGYSLDDNEE